MSRPAMFEFDNTRRDDFVTLMRDVFCAESAARKAVAWDWLFKKPDPTGARTFGRGTQKNGSMVGACLILPHTLWIEGKESQSWWPVAVGVDPRHRGAGLPIVRSFFNQGPYYGGMPANDEIANLYRKLGMTGEVMLRNYFAPLRPGKMLSRRKGLPSPVAGAVDAGYRMASAMAFRNTPSLREDERITNVLHFGTAFNDLWNRARYGYRMTLARDSDYLNWRFHEFPLHSYDTLALWQGETLRGYVVTRLEEKDDRTNGLIVDIFTESGDERSFALLVRAAKGMLERQGAEQAILQLPECAWPVQGLKSLGFVHNKPMTLLQLHAADNQMNAKMPCLHKHWYFTRADSDQDY